MTRALAASTLALAAGIIGCGPGAEVREACDPGPKPARTPPPSAYADTPSTWLGPRHDGHRFHSVHYGRSAVVRYGEPTVGDACSGSRYTFPVTVLTAPRRPETRRRLQRSLGPGLRTTAGIRYGCRRSRNPRNALLTRTTRIEIGTSCDKLLGAIRRLRLVSDGR